MSAPTAAATEALVTGVIRNLVNLRLLKSHLRGQAPTALANLSRFVLGMWGNRGIRMVDIRDSDPDNVGNFKALGCGIPQKHQGTFT